MEITHICIAIAIASPIVMWVWSYINWVWFRPKKIERCLRQQGLSGNPYRLLFGDLKENSYMTKVAMSKPITFSDDIAPRVMPLVHHSIQTYGKNSFTWMGPTPRVNIMEPELIKEILTKLSLFPKIPANPQGRLLVNGLVRYEGEKWAKHRRIINPAFHIDKLKLMLPAFHLSCSEMISKWEEMVSPRGSGEVDVWPSFETLTADALSRTAFGSNYEEGKVIFQLQREQALLFTATTSTHHIPGWRFVPTKKNRKMRKIWKEVRGSLWDIISKRMKILKEKETCDDDLLGLLLKSNMKEIEEHGNNEKLGMSINEVIDECKLFYFAGQETTSALLVWTMILLSKHQNWQQHAREEVLHVFGDNNPNFDGLSRLKIVPMVLLEVLRLYPSVIALTRTAQQDVILGKLNLPAGVHLYIPSILVHRDNEIWGDDPNEFDPERFSEGVSKATKNQASFMPFGWGSRVCIGQNYGMLEAKIAVAMILQSFRFELSPSYTHAPVSYVTLQPQHGAHLILHKL